MADHTNQAAAAEASVENPPALPKGNVRVRVAKTHRFVIDDNTVITSEFQEFSATQAKKVQEAAKANGVKLIVESTDK